MADSFQNEVPKARINLKLDLHTGGASKKMELPLKLLVAGDFSNGKESAQISEREKVNITKNNFDSVLSEYSPKLNLTVKNTLSDDGGEENVQLTFQSMKDFTPEQVAAQIEGHGTNPIVEGSPHRTFNDRAVVVDGCKCQCGCTVISSAQNSTVG
ncbi:type VI secretion system contractile sheath small subunit [Enterobacter asburiae]|uniref:type VI secretion system contractile sheath small subunit n=1 Tax=Enterobacter asburiae TaxID=61645 RepID=UPI002005A2B8|nr:type VI secretion system contractile sheath small subunit [Enterobacter asburiae]MCK6667574.1 type VI secretion system contractile sheath small subunit [Enterobacter asburiae]